MISVTSASVSLGEVKHSNGITGITTRRGEDGKDEEKTENLHYEIITTTGFNRFEVACVSTSTGNFWQPNYIINLLNIS